VMAPGSTSVGCHLGVPLRIMGCPQGIVGVLTFLGAGALLGGLFTSLVCGRIATGPAIGIGLIYGLAIWATVRFLLPLFFIEFEGKLSGAPIVSSALLYGTLMGVWVIVASHLWPALADKCEEPHAGTPGSGGEQYGEQVL
jgi:hypothetical protein